MNIEIKTPYTYNQVKVSQLITRQLSFVELVQISIQTARTRDPAKPFEAALRTARMIAQTQLQLADGKLVPMDAITVLSMPIPPARLLMAAIDEHDANEPMGFTDLSPKADGISAPILIKLGSPIKGQGDKEIAELELQAKSYGDIENVIGETNELEQAVALLRYVAKPIGMLGMPAWAVDAVTIRDGLAIAKQIVPRFLGSDTNSANA